MYTIQSPSNITLRPILSGKKNSSSFQNKKIMVPLKVLTNEKRGGLKVLAFDRSPFKLFSLRFSAKSV